MSSTQLLKDTVKNNPTTFKKIQESFDQILLIIISYGEDDEFSIPLFSSAVKDPRINIRVNEREETLFESKVSYDYDIVLADGELLDENSLENYFYAYDGYIDLFYDELEKSVLDYVNNLYQAVNLAEIREVLSDWLLSIKEEQQVFLDLVMPQLKKISPQSVSKDEITSLFTDFTDRYFHYEINIPGITSLHSICIELHAVSNNEKSYLIQLGDFLVYNDFLRHPSKESSRKLRARILSDIKAEKHPDTVFVSKIYPVYKKKSTEIKSFSIDFASYRESFSEGDSFSIDGENYLIIKIYIPNFVPTSDIQLIGHFKTTPDINETYFLSLESFITCDKRFNEFISKIPAYQFSSDGLINILKEITSISFIEKPILSILIKGFSPIDYDQVLKKGDQYILAITPDYENKLRIKLLIRNLDRLKLNAIKNDKEMNKAQSYSFQLYASGTMESSAFYIYDPIEEYFILDYITSEDRVSECIIPFTLEHFPQFDQSIIYIKRADNHAFDLNDRYILESFYFKEIPQSNIKQISKYLNKRTQEVIEFLRDEDNSLDEFGILYDTLLTNKQVETLQALLEKSFSNYSENNDIRKQILDGLRKGLTEKHFFDQSTGEVYENKFYISNTYIKSKGSNEYRIFIEFNFFSMETETLIIKYKLGEKFFYIDLQTDNITHGEFYAREFKNIIRSSVSDYLSIFPENPGNFVCLEEIPTFIKMLDVYIYPYSQDRSSNSIDVSVGSIIVISEYPDISGNLIKRSDTFFIGDPASKLSYLYEKKKLSSSLYIDLINIKKNYNTNQIVEVYLHYGKRGGLTLRLLETKNNFKIMKIETVDVRKAVELEDTLYYKSEDQVYVKIGKFLGDPDGSHFLLRVGYQLGIPEKFIPERATGSILDIINGLSSGVVDSIKLHFEGNEVIINTDQGRFLFREREIVRVFVSGSYQDISNLPSVDSNYFPYCLGIASDLDKLEMVDKALVMFLREDGNLEQVFFSKGSDNRETTLIAETGQIDNLSMSEDDLKLRVVLNGKQHDFQVDESITYDIFKGNSKGYDVVASGLSIFMIYRNEVMIEQTDFEEVSDFSINNITVVPYFDDIGVWGESGSLEVEVMKFISGLPALTPVSEIISPTISVEEEEEEELLVEMEEEEVSIEKEEIKEDITQEDELKASWDRFTMEQREILLKRLGFDKTMSKERIEEESQNDWEDFNYKRKMVNNYSEAIEIIKELQSIVLSLNFTFEELWNNSDSSQRIDFLKNLGIDEKTIDIHKETFWEYVEVSKIGGILTEAFLEGLALGTQGTESHFEKVYVKIKDIRENKVEVIGIEAGMPVQEFLEFLRRRRIDKKEIVKFVLLNSEINSLDIYTYLDNRYKHRILLRTGEDVIIHNLNEGGSFWSIKMSEGFLCEGISLITLEETGEDVSLESITPSQEDILVKTVQDVEGLWKAVLSEEQKKEMIEIFEIFKSYADTFKILSWDSPELEYFIEVISEPNELRKINDWYKDSVKTTEIQKKKEIKGKIDYDLLMQDSTIEQLLNAMKYLWNRNDNLEENREFLEIVGFNKKDAEEKKNNDWFELNLEGIEFQKNRENILALVVYIKANINELSWNRYLWENSFKGGEIVEAREKGRMIIGEVIRVSKNRMTNPKSVRVKPLGIYAQNYPGVNHFTVKKIMSTDGELVSGWGVRNALLPLTREELSLWQQGIDLTQIHKKRSQQNIKSIQDVEKSYKEDYRESISALLDIIEGRGSGGVISGETWESYINIDEINKYTYINSIPEGRLFTDDEREFFQGLLDTIGIDCSVNESNLEISCGILSKEQKEELLKYIKNFYEYLQ